MELALFWYTILNLAILGSVLLFVRASRHRARADERPDLEENALLSVDWELVRRERCGPSGCPRVIGQPPRPRKDVTCEICAATFLELRLRRLLETSATEATGLAEILPDPERLPGLASEPRPAGAQKSPGLALSVAGEGPKRRHGDPAARWAQIRVALGVLCVALGGVLAAFGGLTDRILLGAVAVLIGLALMASGVVSSRV
jgi:hypothetical protein